MRHKLWTTSTIKKTLARWIVMVLGMAWTFANGQPDPALLKQASFMYNAITFLSWVRVLLCMLAGKVMTNGLLFGGSFGLDVYLREIWNVMKNFANFALGFVFLIVVLREIFGLEIQESLGHIAEKVQWFLFGGLIIQASWFILLAMISVSTITSTAAAALPSMVIQADSSRWSKIISQVNSKWALNWSQYIIKSNNTWSPKNLTLQYITGTNTNTTNEEILDFLMPRYDNLWWSLYFMGMSVVGFQNYTTYNPVTNTDLKTQITWFTIKLAITLTYAILIIILIVINIIRIIRIWIAIALLPLNMVLRVLKHEKVWFMDGETDLWNYVGKFTWTWLIQMVLQPTLIMLVMGISMITLAGFWWVLGSTNTVNTNAINAAYNVTITNTWLQTSNVDFQTLGDILDGTISQWWGIFQDLILIMLTFGLMWLIVYTSAAITKEEFVKNMVQWAGGLIAKIPFLPITQNMGAITKAVDNVSGGKLKEAYDIFKWRTGLDEEAAGWFADWLWNPNPKTIKKRKETALKAKDFETFQNATKNRYITNKDFWEIYNSEWWKKHFVDMYSTYKNKPYDLKINSIDDLDKVMGDAAQKAKLRKVLFPEAKGADRIKGFDDFKTSTPPATTTNNNTTTTPPQK